MNAIPFITRLSYNSQGWQHPTGESGKLESKESFNAKHAEALETVTRVRKEDLIKAAGWWRLFKDAEDFISECEKRWRLMTSELAKEQVEWLKWARETVAALSPFETGYPDPKDDGNFEPEAVSFGGPYP